MTAPSSYLGKLPFELYVELVEKFPQTLGENDVQWLERIKRDSTLAHALFGTKQFSGELIAAVNQRQMAQSGAQRVGQANYGVALRSPNQIWPAKMADVAINRSWMPLGYWSKMGPHQQMADVAKQFRDDEKQYNYADGAYKLLLEQFDATTPKDGSIFWNGINELALAKLVDEWNGEHEIFGQLEATTAARYVNKKFVWDEEGVFQKYFTEVSAHLGKKAKGHVTAVVRCGLREDSILTKTELPKMLKGIEESLKGKADPDITDITIVVIEPKELPDWKIRSFTNNEIRMIPIVLPVGKNHHINGRGDCSIDKHLDLSIRVVEYWTKRGQKSDSPAAAKIKADFASLTKWP